MNRQKKLWLTRIAAVTLAAAATQAQEIGRRAMTITYDDGSQQNVPLEKPSSAIIKVEYGDAGADPREGRTYTDRGEKISVPCGEKAFASRVASYAVGSPAPVNPAYRNPQTALGPPDYVSDDRPGSEVSLGCGGSIVLEFENVRLTDVAGPDIHVFEVGAAVEPTRLEISPDGQRWIDIGQISGGRASVDIREHAEPGRRFRYVRLTDLRSSCGGEWPGADIDAVAAVGCAAVKR